MSRALDNNWPAWLRNVDALLAVHPHFVLSGNIRDRYPLPDEESPIADTLPVALQAVLAGSGYDTILLHDLVSGYRVLHVDEDDDAGWAAVQAVVGTDLQSAAADDLDVLVTVLQALAAGGSRRLVLVLDYASRLVVSPASLRPPEHRFFTACLKATHEAEQTVVTGAARRALYNPAFWLVEREHDLPAWFTAGNSRVRAIPIPWPDLRAREDVVGRLLAAAGQEGEQAAPEIARRTDGFGVGGLFDVAALLHDQQIALTDAADAVRLYTVGSGESPWRQGAMADRLRRLGDGKDSILSHRVLGQPRAVTKAADILKRAVLGLSGAQAGPSSSRPRGVLFFAGPTGTGKTELAKAITELVFGTDQAYVRFDMSEFSSEHAGDRLIGAPPGYVGFEGGGELTNAVRRRPNSLLLFDEVEKAHPRILDKFLQLLDDGRLTDGRGTTVHFSETIVVFTSNLGMFVPAQDGTDRLVPNATPADSYDVVASKIQAEVRRFFNEELNRPELLNRIGDNTVIFDFIGPETAAKITDLQVANIVSQVARSSGVRVEVTPEARHQLHTIATADLTHGGRGIGNVLESRFINPLARALFDLADNNGGRVTVTAILDGEVPEVELR